MGCFGTNCLTLEEDDKNIEFTQSGSPVIPAPEEKVLDASSYILSKQEKSKKKKY